MKIQRDKYSCGIFAIINSLRALGLKVTEKRVKPHTGTTKAAGTNEFGILGGLLRLGVLAEERRIENEDEVFNIVLDTLKGGASVVLDFYKGQHWISLIGVIGDRVVVADSDWGIANKRENGIHVLSKEQLLRKWSRSEDGKRYLIIVSLS